MFSKFTSGSFCPDVFFYHQGKLPEQPQTLSANQIHSGQININTSEISSEVRNQDLSQESVLTQV